MSSDGTSNDLPPDDLTQRAMTGDRAAIGELLYLSADELTRHIKTRMPPSIKNVVDPDDIVQETFSAAYRDIDKFTPRGPNSFLAWLRTIAEHRIQDAAKGLNRKKRGGDRQRIEGVRQYATDSVMNLFDLLVTDESTPLRRASRRESLRCMQVALAELPDQYQEVVRLQYMEDMSHQDIAEAMGRTPAAVHGLIKRGKRSLKELLGEASAYLSSR